jgi:hypothetical protein
LKRKLLYIILSLILSSSLYSQGPLDVRDTIANLKIFNTFLANDNTLEFDLMISRTSDVWEKFTNGTFQFEFGSKNDIINAQDITVELLETELPQQLITGNVLPESGYYIENQIFDQRMSITILGPPDFQQSQYIPKDTFFLLGRFAIRTTNGEKIPPTLRWKRPVDYYQALAYKLEQDSIVRDFIVWYEDDDNIEMNDRYARDVDYDDGEADSLLFVLDFFDADYAGRKYVDLRLATLAEVNNLGFTILRAPHVNIAQDPYTLDYQDTVFTFLQGQYFNPDLIGKGNTRTGHVYEENQDLVPYRGGQYCYALFATFEFSDGSRLDSLVAIDCDVVPHAVITRAHPHENPFTYKTTIEYELEDDVILTAKAYDLLGREIKLMLDDATGDVIENKEMDKGIHYTTFVAPELASQGLYDIVFIAEPIDDSSFESSTAVVKVQLIK